MQSQHAEGCPHHRDLAAPLRLSINVLSAQRRELARLQKAGVLEYAVMQEIEIELDLAELALGRLDAPPRQT